MKKLRYCKRCGKVFTALGKFSRICDDCYLNKGGWHRDKINKKLKEYHPYSIDCIIGSKKWAYQEKTTN